MKNYIGLISFCFFLNPIITFAQVEKPLITKVDNKYQFENESYKRFKNMESIFQTDELSYQAFKKARKAEKNVYVWAGFSAAFLATAVISIDTANGNNTENFDNAVISVFGGIFSGISAIGAVFQKLKSNKKRKKAIVTFNNRSLDYQSYLLKKDKTRISFSQNGIILNF